MEREIKFKLSLILYPSQIVWPIFHFGISQNKVFFLKLTYKIPNMSLTLFKNLMRIVLKTCIFLYKKRKEKKRKEKALNDVSLKNSIFEIGLTNWERKNRFSRIIRPYHINIKLLV